MKKLLVLVLLALPLLAFSQAVPSTDPVPRVAFPLSPVGNVTTVGSMTADASNAAKFSFGVAANGAVYANSGASMPTPGGSSIPLSVSGQIAKTSVTAALGRFMAKSLPLLNTGVALYDLAKELGFTLGNSSGPIVVTQTDPESCPAGGCTQYRYSVGGVYGNWSQNYTTACQLAATAGSGSGLYNYVWASSPGPSTCNLTAYYKSNGSLFGTYNYGPASTQSSPVIPVTQIASTPQAFIDAVAAKSGWPASSALARTTVDAINSGEVVQVDPQSVTGPATSPGVRTVTTDTVNNTTTTTNTTNNYSYAGNTITTTNTTTSTTVNNSTQAIVASTSATTTPVAAPATGDKPVTCGLPGTPACKLDETGTPSAPTMALDQTTLNTQATNQRNTITGNADKHFLDGWANVFTTPPVVGCSPFTYPQSNVSVDPCPVVDGVRTVMSFIWALAAFWLCLAWIREVI